MECIIESHSLGTRGWAWGKTLTNSTFEMKGSSKCLLGISWGGGLFFKKPPIIYISSYLAPGMVSIRLHPKLSSIGCLEVI